MGWRDNLFLDGKGSFRGKEFYVSVANSQIGRRTIIREFPGRDEINSEDLGLRPREFKLDAYVLGDNYMYDRDQLRQAFETAGSGKLVHPYWGNLTVVVRGPVQISETTADGGMAKLSMTLVEVSDTLAPVVRPDTSQAVETACDDANTAVAESFESEWSVIGAIADVVQAAINLVNAVVSDINKIKGYVNAAMAVVDAIGDAIEAVADAVTSLILLPGQLVDQFQSIVNGVVQAIANIGDAWNSYFGDDETPGSVAGDPATAAIGVTPASSDARIDLAMRSFRDMFSYGDDLSAVTGTTQQREQQATNQVAFVDMIRTLAVTETARGIAVMPFSNSTKAESVRDELADAIDTLMETADDTVYGTLADLRAAIADHLTDVSADLPSVSSYTPAEAMPALVIAQILYGDATRDAEIIARNGIRNPAIVPASESLEVLSDE